MHQSEIKITPHFTFGEFNCKDGTPVPPHLFFNLRMLCGAMEGVRMHFKAPIVVHSGYRSHPYNIKVGGASKSYHLLSMACDFSIVGVPSSHIFNQMKILIEKGFLPKGGLIKYPNFVHYDIRGYNFFKD